MFKQVAANTKDWRTFMTSAFIEIAFDHDKYTTVLWNPGIQKLTEIFMPYRDSLT